MKDLKSLDDNSDISATLLQSCPTSQTVQVGKERNVSTDLFHVQDPSDVLGEEEVSLADSASHHELMSAMFRRERGVPRAQRTLGARCTHSFVCTPPFDTTDTTGSTDGPRSSTGNEVSKIERTRAPLLP